MIVLFPTYARRIAGGTRWRATVAGMVVRPLPATSRRRVLAMAVFRRLFDLDEDPALIACSIAEHPGVEARYVRRTTLAGWLDWDKIAVTYLEPLLHDVCKS
jgi:hypothetical protein